MVGNIIENKWLEQSIRESLTRRSIQVQTSVEVAQHIAAAPGIGELFHRVVTLVKERFNYYHVQLFRYLPAEDAVVLITGYGEIGQKMLEAGHKLAMGRGVVGTAAATGQSILAADVARDLDWRPNPNLPATKGELAVPIKLGTGDAEAQVHALEHFATSNYAGIAVAAIDPEAIARITHESVQNGKPVVAISIDLGQDHQTTALISVEHTVGYLLGVEAGTWAKQHLLDAQSVKIGVLTCRTLPNVVEREHGIIDGIQSVIGERATVVVNADALEAKEAAYLAEGWLHNHPDLNMILAYNDATALGAYQAAQNAGWRDPDQFFIGGIDGVPEALAAIQQGGVYQATVNQPPEVMGIMVVRTLIAAIKGVPVKPVSTLYCALINRSNAAEFAGSSREAAVLANQDIIPVEALSDFDVSGLRLGLSVLTLANPFFATLAASAHKEAQRLGVQLVVNDPSRVLGVLDVQSDQANALTDDDRLLLEGLCGQIASALESTRLLEQLRLNEAQLSEALKIAKLGYWEYNVEKDLFLFNDQFYSIFHTTAEQAGGYQLSSAQYAQQFVHPDDLPMVGGEIERALNSTDRHYTRDLEHRILYIDGGVGYISVNINIERDEQGHILRYYGANQDITERKRIEEDLRAAHTHLAQALDNVLQFEAAFNHTNAGMAIVSPDGRFMSVNSALCDLLGYTREELERKRFGELTHPDDVSSSMAFLRQALAGEIDGFRTEKRYLHKTGEVIWIELSTAVLRDADQQPLYFVSQIQDIRQRKQAEAERERLLHEQERRAVQLQTASEVSRGASSILNLGELLPQTAELIRTRFELYYVGIFLLDDTAQWAVLRAGTGEAGHIMLANNHRLEIGGNSMISQCVVMQRARIALDVGEEAVRFENPLLPLTRSEMALPLVSRGRIIGAMTIQSDQPAAFTLDDITALQSMADQIGNAVENARLYVQTQAALSETDQLLQASAELNVSKSYTDVLDVIRKYTVLGQQALTIAINTFDRPWTESQTPTWIEVIGYYTKRASGIDVGTRFPIAMFPSAQSLLHPDAPSIIENFDTAQTDPNTYALFVHRFAAKSVIFTPLVVGGQWFGYMNVLYSNPAQFNEVDVRRLAAMVSQAAVAVQNLRNLATAQQTLTETEASYRATQAIGRAETVEGILEAATHIVDLIGMTRAILRVVSRRDVNNMVMATDIYAYHRVAGQWMLQPVAKDVPASDAITLRSLQRNPEAVAIYADAQNPNSAMPDEVRQALLAGQLRSIISTSVSLQNEVLGFLSFSGPQALNEGAEQRLRIAIRTLSDQVAVALQNRLLFEQTRAALQEVDAINRRLTGEAWENYLHQQAGRDVIWLADDDAAAPEALSQLDEPLTTGEITIEPDPADSAEATVTAPILLRGQPIGALRLRTPLSEWDEDSEAMLADIAGHIAQAVENARLVEQTQRTAQRERTINEINARVRQSVDLDAILRTAVNELGQSLKAARVVARVGTMTAEGAAATEGSTVAGDGRGKSND
ncbi:MAG TPA: GAF domain-containing protein [Anaerolineae bacterium]|nr:GAF domain-containing protein [Anaerolineae bacterium]